MFIAICRYIDCDKTLVYQNVFILFYSILFTIYYNLWLWTGRLAEAIIIGLPTHIAHYNDTQTHKRDPVKVLNATRETPVAYCGQAVYVYRWNKFKESLGFEPQTLALPG